jgi:BphX-like
MNGLKWWFRLVGAFYLLLAVVNVYGTFVAPSSFAQMQGFATNPDVVKAFVVGWSPFAFEIIGIATFLLWASRDPLKYLGAVWLLVWLEFLHGVLDDMYLIANGLSVGFYTAFTVVHLIIIVTGILVARQTSARSSQVARLAVK